MKIKELRNKYGLSQQALADLLGMPKRTIENWEGGTNECKPYLLNLIENFLFYHFENPVERLHISYECSALISELKSDIAEFGKQEPCCLFWQVKSVKIPFNGQTIGVEFLVNYDFVDEDNPLTEEEKENFRTEFSTLGRALEILEKQNEISTNVD